MQVLLIGGTEFISLHLVRALLRDGHRVAVLNRGRNPARLPAGVRTIVCDRTDHAALRRALATERCDALVDITYAPTTGADVEALLDALDGRAGHAVFVSTGRVHDHALPIPYHEDTPRNLYWGEYAKNKIAGEDVLNETFFFDRLVRNRPILVPGAGGWLRQFGHVDDLTDAMAAMLGVPAAFGQAYNVTGEEAVTQVGFVELIGEVLKRPVTLVHVEPPAGGKPVAFGQNLVYDCHAVYTTTKIRAELGIRPRYSLAAGLAQTYEWYVREGLDRRDVDFSAEDAHLR